MESIFGIGCLAKEVLIASMIKAYEKEIQDTAWIASLVREATRSHPLWYCPLLLRIGEMLIASGTYLKAHYST